MTFKLPELPYGFDYLEPVIDAKTMEIHHDKHHAAYVNNLNAALEKHPEFEANCICGLLKNIDSVPADIRQAVINNGGGHHNHSLFWQSLTKADSSEFAGLVKEKVEAEEKVVTTDKTEATTGKPASIQSLPAELRQQRTPTGEHLQCRGHLRDPLAGREPAEHHHGSHGMRHSLRRIQRGGHP